MKPASYGRLVFGAAAVLFGVIGLLWRDPDTWQSPTILKLPFVAAVTAILALAQIAGGFGMFAPRTLRAASIVLAAVYAIFSLACIPGILHHPAAYVAYGNFFEWFSLVCGALAAFAATQTGARSLSIGRTARIGMGLCLVSFTLAQLFYFQLTASLVPAWILPNQAFWVVLTTIAFALAAIAVLVNVRARLALQLTFAMLTVFGLLVWVPAVAGHPEMHGNWSEFTLNFLIAGAVWTLAGVPADFRDAA